MKKIAIDVVVIPPEEIVNESIAINKQLSKNNPENIILDKQTCVPHISLCMGVINENDLENIKNLLNTAVNQINNIELEINKIKNRINSRGQRSHSFDIEKSLELQQLHELIMKNLKPFFLREVSEDYFVTPPEIKDPTMKWVLEYLETSAFDKFNPHISLGFGEFEDEIKPIKFQVSKIGIFQLGDYCTCRKLLHSFKLRS